MQAFKLVSSLLLSLLVLTTALAATGCQGLPALTPAPTTVPPSPLPTLPPPTLTPLPATPAPRETPGRSYVNTALGISLSYPGDWLLRETEKGVVFGTSQQVIEGEELTRGAGLALFVEPLTDTGAQSLEELCASQASVFAAEETEVSGPHTRTIGGQRGVTVALQGTPGLGGTRIRGLVAATTWEGWVYTFVGLSVAREWATYGVIVEKMLDDVQFMPREQAEHALDAWEPDDSLTQAKEIEIASSQTHDLHIQGDRDYLQFPATRGHVYTIETANLGDDIDTKIFLYDDEGNLLAQDDDGRNPEEPWASRLIWTAEKTNILYLMVQDVGDNDAGPGTVYEIRVWEQVHFVEDEYEPDDSPELATRLEVGTGQPHNLHFPADQDWMRFEAKAGTLYVIETFDLGSSVDTVMHLFNEDGNELAENDNGRDEEEPLASRIQWTARRDAFLYVVVRDLEDDDAGRGTEYWVRLGETRP